MTVTCSICHEILNGPEAPALIDSIERARAEFEPLYPLLYHHVATRHAELVPVLRPMIETCTMILLTKTFQSTQPEFAALASQMIDALCNTLRATFEVTQAAPNQQNGRIIV